MPLSASAIGPYTIEREIGRGGMGVVYLATDSRLGRKVAIKALPEHLAADPDRLARFEREARTLASLNHPNVGAIHGVETQDSRRFLILEYVEGSTLQEVIDRGPVPLEDAIEYGAQIAAGVEAAHDAGVIHRDLKPGNVKITPEGQAKVLDFGLARSVDGASSSSMAAMSQSPTLAAPPHSPTIAGAILGTAPYMSPEQARGRSVDKRTDVWSFGVVLYEMLSGASPFAGESASDSIGAVLHKEVDLGRLPPGTPAGVRRLIGRCLTRDKSLRLQSMGDARVELRLAQSAPAEAAAPAGRARPRAWLVAALVGAIALAVGLTLGRAVVTGAPRPRPIHLAIPSPWRTGGDAMGFESFALSPDGERIAYVASPGPDEPNSIFVRSLHERAVRVLPGTENARGVGFSPDSRRVLVAVLDWQRDREGLILAPFDGGPPLALFEGPIEQFDMSARAWAGPDHVLIMEKLTDEDRWRILRVSTASGRAEPVFEIEMPGPEEAVEGWMSIAPVPGDRALLTLLKGEGFTTWAVDLASGPPRQLLDGSFARYMDGRIFFTRADVLCAAPFDPETLAVTGPVTPLLSGLAHGTNIPSWTFHICEAGHLAYVGQTREESQRRLVTVDRAGVVAPLVEARREYEGALRLSRDGGSIAVVMRDKFRPQIGVIDLNTHALRVIDDPEPCLNPFWAPDGSLLYQRLREPQWSEIIRVKPEGLAPGDIAPGEPLMPEEDRKGEQAWAGAEFTPDGAFLLFHYRPHDGRPDGIYTTSFPTPGVPALVAAPGGQPSLSPDGALLAHTLPSFGEAEIVVRPFDPRAPAEGRLHRFSGAKGYNPHWSPDGKSLIFANALGQVLEAAVTREPALAVGAPRVLFDRSVVKWADEVQPIVPMPDGERILVVEEAGGEDQPPHISIILNWMTEVEERVPVR